MATAGSFTQYDNFTLGEAEGKFDLATDTYVMTLVSSSYTPNVATDIEWSSVSADELPTGGGYTAGGVIIPSETLSLASHVVTWTGGAVSWSNFTATATYGVVVRRAGSTLASTDLLVAYVALNVVSGSPAPLVGQGGTLTITPSASGIIQFSHTP